MPGAIENPAATAEPGVVVEIGYTDPRGGVRLGEGERDPAGFFGVDIPTGAVPRDDPAEDERPCWAFAGLNEFHVRSNPSADRARGFGEDRRGDQALQEEAHRRFVLLAQM